MTLFLSSFGIYSMQTDIAATASQKNAQYSDYLTSSTLDAVKVMKESANGTTLLPDEADRERVVNAFFNSLAMDFGYDTNEDLTKLRMYVPVFAMIDTDGYYICFNTSYTDVNNIPKLKSNITSLNTLSKTQGKYIVRYYLGSKVDVTDKESGRFVTGEYKKVYEDLGMPAELLQLGFDNEDDFRKNRNEVVIPAVQKSVTYYINNQNRVAAQLQPSYKFEMPLTDEDEWARLLENPTCLAFLQGVRVSNSSKVLNVYSLGGGEVKKTAGIVYSEDSNKIRSYYEADNSPISGGEVSGYVASDKDVAKAGADVDYRDIDPAQTEKTEVHHHWGDPLLGTGCYRFGTPHYHIHTSDCYSNTYHVHTASCKAPVIHHHIQSCYRDVFHHHTGDRTLGTGCYQKKVFHQHDRNCMYQDANGRYYLNQDGTCKKGLTSDTFTWEPNCGYVDLDNMSDLEKSYYYPSDKEVTELLSKTSDWNTLSTQEQEDKKEEYLSDLDYQAHYNARESSVLVCGLHDGDIEPGKYTYICGKKEGELESQTLTCGKTVNDIEYYDMGCGLTEGQVITSEQAAKYNQP